MASGKQVLLSILTEYSQRRFEESQLDEVSDRLKGALLVHCSSAHGTLGIVEKMGWLSQSDEDGVLKQGLELKKKGIFLSDLFEELAEDDQISERITKRFPGITQEDFSDSLSIIWWLLSSIQYWEELSGVENEGKLDIAERERSIKGYQKMLEHYRNDAENY